MKTKLYATFLAKKPRAHQWKTFEVPISSNTDVTSIQNYIKENSLRDIGTIALVNYKVDETSFVDSDGITQAIVFKSLFPISSERSDYINAIFSLS